jgi:hypothetical protein
MKRTEQEMVGVGDIKAKFKETHFYNFLIQHLRASITKINSDVSELELLFGGKFSWKTH